LRAGRVGAGEYFAEPLGDRVEDGVEHAVERRPLVLGPVAGGVNA
jgi:hypothetical protein